MSQLAGIGYSLLGVGALNLSLGAALFSGRRRDPLRSYAAAIALFNALYCCMIGIAYVRAALGLDYELYYRGGWVGWVCFAPFFQIIYTVQGKPRLARVLGMALYAFWGGVLVLCLCTSWVEVGAESLLPFVDRVGPLEQPLRGLGAASLVFALFEMGRAHRASSGRRRQQTGYLLLGMALYAVSAILLAGVAQLTQSVHFDPGLVAYFSVTWVACTAYSVHRSRLFDIRFVLSRGVDGLLLSALFAGLQIVLFRALAPVMQTSVAVVLTSLGAALAVFLTPLLPLVQRATERLFVHRRYDYGQTLKESAQALAASVRVEDVLRELVAIARDTLGVDSAALLLREGDRFVVRQAFGATPRCNELSANGALATWLSRHMRIFVRDEHAGLPMPELAAMDEELGAFDSEAVLPLSHQRAISAILVLGRKRDRDAYLQTDVDLLETLGTEAGIALSNARLLDEREQAIRVRDEFLSVAGHELRTPLTAIQLNVQSLLDPPPSDARTLRRLDATGRQIARLVRLTDELLDVSRITTHHLTLEREPIDLAELGKEVAARFAADARRTSTPFELVCTEEVRGTWDRMRIDQVLGNLLTNAFKYGAGTPVSLRIERTGDRARITITDGGVGIAEPDQRRIFERFERAVSQDHYGGFGLGLWITKQVVDAHGGTISVRSAHGAGSTFVVELPRGE